MSQSPDLAICRFRNLKISQSWNLGISRLQCRIAIFGICADLQLTRDDVCTMSDVPEPWDTWITRCATWDMRWHVPPTMSWVSHTVPHDTCHTAWVVIHVCACLGVVSSLITLRVFFTLHMMFYLSEEGNRAPPNIPTAHTDSCVHATCACTPHLLCRDLQMLDSACTVVRSLNTWYTHHASTTQITNPHRRFGS